MLTEDIPKKAKEHYDHAVRILREDMTQSCSIVPATDIVIDSLRQAVGEYDEFFEAWRLLGEVYMGTEQPLYGYLALRKAFQIREDDTAVATLLGDACLILNRPKLAHEFLKTALEDEEVPLAAKKLRAITLAKAEKWDDVLGAFGDALAGDPSDGGMRRECARVLNKLGYPKEAVSVLADYVDPYRHFIEKQSEILESGWIMKTGTVLDRLTPGAAKLASKHEIVAKPEDFGAWYDLGNIFLDGEKYNAAVACFKSALKVHTDYYDALHNMGMALEEMGGEEHALRMYEAAIEVNPDIPEGYLSIAELLEEMSPDETDEIALNYLMYYRLDPESEGFDEFEKEIRERLEESPDIAQIILLVQVYLLREETDKARSALRLIESEASDEAAIQWLMGRISQEGGDLTGAEKAYMAGLNILEQDSGEPPIDDDDVEAKLRFDFAALLEESENPGKAREILEGGIEILDADGLTLLAELLLAENPKEAEETWQKALIIDPEHSDALLGVADRMIETDRIVEGIILLEQAMIADPEDEDIVDRLRELYTKIDASELSPSDVD